jgi:hypothetical protein
LEGTFLALKNYHQLEVTLYLPLQSISFQPENSYDHSSSGIPCNLKINVNTWQIQSYITSTKWFVNEAPLLLNNITKAVLVDYMPLPVGPDHDGNFNLSMIITFHPQDFNLQGVNQNSKCIIQISEAGVNRI